MNNSDPSGYWGEEVHYGFNKNNKKTNYRYTTKVNGVTQYYGTYAWAYAKGFRQDYAKKLGAYCIELDRKFSSSQYFISTVGYGPGIYTKKQMDQYYYWQGYHFNLYKNKRDSKTGKFADSRLEYADEQKKLAIKNWKKGKKDDALKALGYGLHAIQDVSAHGQIGRGKKIPQHVIGTKALRMVDNINYDWSDYGQTRVKESSQKKRLMATKRDTYKYLDDFIRCIGGAKKIK